MSISYKQLGSLSYHIHSNIRTPYFYYKRCLLTLFSKWGVGLFVYSKMKWVDFS